MGFIWFIVIGALAGFLAGKIMRGGGFGFIMNLIIGIIGGLLGGWLFGILGISTANGLIGSLITALVGAVVLLWIISFSRKNNRNKARFQRALF
ncbi:MAG: GlsB/YeaQ/YmgE family stress response membrane protein [Flavobacteriales bacterium]|nr:GlsB/YeaQ/YmgE family stress response membrane protein [Flavobacteriales bacterium]